MSDVVITFSDIKNTKFQLALPLEIIDGNIKACMSENYGELNLDGNTLEFYDDEIIDITSFTLKFYITAFNLVQVQLLRQTLHDIFVFLSVLFDDPNLDSIWFHDWRYPSVLCTNQAEMLSAEYDEYIINEMSDPSSIVITLYMKYEASAWNTFYTETKIVFNKNLIVPKPIMGTKIINSTLAFPLLSGTVYGTYKQLKSIQYNNIIKDDHIIMQVETGDILDPNQILFITNYTIQFDIPVNNSMNSSLLYDSLIDLRRIFSDPNLDYILFHDIYGLKFRIFDDTNSKQVSAGIHQYITDILNHIPNTITVSLICSNKRERIIMIKSIGLGG